MEKEEIRIQEEKRLIQMKEIQWVYKKNEVEEKISEQNQNNRWQEEKNCQKNDLVLE